MVNPFHSIIDRLTGLWQKSSESVVGIDIGSSSMKAVQIRKQGGRAILETYGELFLGPYGDLAIGQSVVLEPEKLAEALRDLLRESNVTAKHTAVSAPLKSSLVTMIEIPTPDENKLAEMVPIEARKYIPVPVSEVSLDWWVIPKRSFQGGPHAESGGDGKTSEVILVAIHNNVLSQIRDMATAAGVPASTVEIEVFSTVRSVLGNDIAPVMILDMGSSSTKTMIVDYGVVRTAHSVMKGSQEITLALARSQGIPFDKAEEIKKAQGITGGSVALSLIDTILYDANTVLSNYQKKYGRTITKVILSGGGSLLRGLKERAQNTFNVDVVYGNPFSKLYTPAFLEQMLGKVGPEFSVAVGLALRKLNEIDNSS